MITNNEQPSNSIINYLIHVVKSDSLDVCTYVGLYYSAESLPITHKVSSRSSKVIILQKTRTSCFSHHMNWSTLCESDRFIRVSRCNLTWILKSPHTLLYHQKGFPHEISTHNSHIISWHYHLIPNIWNIVPNTTQYMHNIIYHT